MGIYDDYSMAISLGYGPRLAAFRVFRDNLVKCIEARGFNATDPKLFNMATIEVQAMRLADEASDLAAQRIDGELATVVGAGEALPDIPPMIETFLTEAIGELGRKFEGDEIFGLAYLIQIASGTPDPTLGFDQGDGPQ